MILHFCISSGYEEILGQVLSLPSGGLSSGGLSCPTSNRRWGFPHPGPCVWPCTPRLQRTFHVASRHRQPPLAGFCGNKVAPPPPHMMPEGFTGRKRDARNNREKGNQSQGHSKTIIPPGRLLVRPPPHCWYRKGSYQGSSEERLCSARGKFT